MPIDDFTIEQIDGSTFHNTDKVVVGMQYGVVNYTSPGPIASVTVGTAGSYASIPTLGTTGHGSGATLVAHMGALTSSPAAVGSGYAPADTITLTGGTESANAVITVNTTKLVSVAVNAGGSGYAVGDTITLAGGTFGTAAIVTVATLSTTAVATVTITDAGSYTANTASFTQGSTSGSGTGATFHTSSFGVNTCAPTTAGSYTVLPSNPVSQGSTSGSGTSATINVNTWEIATISVSAGGTLYDSSSALTITGGGSTGGGAGTLSLTNTGIAATVPIAFVGYELPTNYSVYATPDQACFVNVTSKTNNGFNIVLTPLSANTIAAGHIDVLVVV